MYIFIQRSTYMYTLHPTCEKHEKWLGWQQLTKIDKESFQIQIGKLENKKRVGVAKIYANNKSSRIRSQLGRKNEPINKMVKIYSRCLTFSL